MESRNSHILSLLENKTADYADRVALGMKGTYGWAELTYKGLGLLSRKIAHHLIEDLGIKKGETLAILSESKPEYGPCVFASVLTGTITVPLDVKLSKYELQSILSDCLPSVLICSQTYLPMALELQKEIPEIKHILGKSVELPESIKKLYEKENDKNIIEPDIKSVKKLLKMYF